MFGECADNPREAAGAILDRGTDTPQAHGPNLLVEKVLPRRVTTLWPRRGTRTDVVPLWGPEVSRRLGGG
ncbi:hypothetical protein GCM10009603_60320 [Nocardiopsis exhalans]